MGLRLIEDAHTRAAAGTRQQDSRYMHMLDLWMELGSYGAVTYDHATNRVTCLPGTAATIPPELHARMRRNGEGLTLVYAALHAAAGWGI